MLRQRCIFDVNKCGRFEFMALVPSPAWIAKPLECPVFYVSYYSTIFSSLNNFE